MVKPVSEICIKMFYTFLGGKVDVVPEKWIGQTHGSMRCQFCPKPQGRPPKRRRTESRGSSKHANYVYRLRNERKTKTPRPAHCKIVPSTSMTFLEAHRKRLINAKKPWNFVKPQ